MKQKFLKKGLVLTALSAVGLVGAGVVGADKVSAISLGDGLQINPVYQQYLDDVAMGKGSEWAIIPNKYIIVDNTVGGKGADKTLPTKYNLVEEGYGTTLKNQGTDGDCWAFALTTAIESNLKKNNITEEFSPKQMDYLMAGDSPYYKIIHDSVGIERGVGDGGNFVIASYILGGQYTPIKEATFFDVMKKNDSQLSKYNSWSQYNDLALLNANLSGAETPYTKPMSNELLFSNKSKYVVSKYDGYVGSKDEVAKIKQDVYENGAVWVGTYAPGTDKCWDENSKTIIDRGSLLCGKQNGHAMAIVGWDDTHTYKDPKDNSVKTGAFLLQNSWGKDDLFEKNGITADDVIEGIESQGMTLTNEQKQAIKQAVNEYDALEYIWLGYDFEDGFSGTINFATIEEVIPNNYKNIYDITKASMFYEGEQTAKDTKSIEYKYSKEDKKEEYLDSVAISVHLPLNLSGNFVVSIDKTGKGDKYEEVGRIPFVQGIYGQRMLTLDEQVEITDAFMIKIEPKTMSGAPIMIGEDLLPYFTIIAYTAGEMEVPNTSDPGEKEPEEEPKDKPSDKNDKNKDDKETDADELKVPNTGIFGQNELSVKIVSATIVLLAGIGIGVGVFKNRKHLFHKVDFNKK